MGILKNLFKPPDPYRRNPEGGTLSRAEIQAISVGAILTESNCEFIDSLQPATPKEIKQRKQHQLLEQWWDIASAQEAIDGLESLKNRGHRRVFQAVLANIPQALELEPTFDDFHRAFEGVGLPIAGEEISREYPRETELTKRHIDVLCAAYNSELEEEAEAIIDKHAALFGNDETLDICMHIFEAMLDRYEQYAEFAYNLRQAFEKLQGRGFVDNAAGLASINPAAWDMGRMVNVARWCYACGYITKAAAWEYILFAGDESARQYADWTGFGKGYIMGRAIWGGDSALDDMMDIVDGLHKDEESPWRRAPLR